MASDETTTETEEKFATVPFTEDLSKAEMTDHIYTMHGITYIDGQHVSPHMKMTKANLVRYHDRVHKVLDDPRAKPGYPRDGYNGFFNEESKRDHYASTPATPHTHDAVMMPGNTDDMIQKAKNNEPVSEKPLSATERRVLTDLVNNDFKALEQEMRQFAADLLKTKMDEIKSDWAARIEVAPNFEKKARRIAEAAVKKFEELKEAAKAEGIELKSSYSISTNFQPKAEVEGYALAIKEAQEENAKLLQRGLLTLERQRLTAQRRVLVSGITRQAATILDEVPKAKELMVTAAADEARGRAIPAELGGKR